MVTKKSEKIISGGKKESFIAVLAPNPYVSNEIASHIELELGIKTLQEHGIANAVALCEKMKPDLVILDTGLGDEDGYEVVRQLPKFKIILFTAMTDFVRKKEYKNLLEVVEKPVNQSQLIQLVKKHLNLI